MTAEGGLAARGSNSHMLFPLKRSSHLWRHMQFTAHIKFGQQHHQCDTSTGTCEATRNHSSPLAAPKPKAPKVGRPRKDSGADSSFVGSSNSCSEPSNKSNAGPIPSKAELTNSRAIRRRKSCTSLDDDVGGEAKSLLGPSKLSFGCNTLHTTAGKLADSETDSNPSAAYCDSVFLRSPHTPRAATPPGSAPGNNTLKTTSFYTKNACTAAPWEFPPGATSSKMHFSSQTGKDDSSKIRSSTRGSTSNIKAFAAHQQVAEPSRPWWFRPKYNYRDLLDSDGVKPNTDLWALPGMAPGSKPASMEALLQYLEGLPSHEVYALVKQMHEPLYKPVPTDTYRTFVCDTETTTAMQNANYRVIDVCVLDVITGDKFSTLVDPEECIPSSASRIHEITNATVKGAPKGPHVWLALLLWIHQRCEQMQGGSRALLVAQNVNFDTKHLGLEFARVGMWYPDSWTELCTLPMAKNFLPELAKSGSYKLENVAAYLGFDTSNLRLHRAEPDCMLTCDVVTAMLERSLGKGNSLLQSVTLSHEDRLERHMAIMSINYTNRSHNIMGALERMYPKHLTPFLYERYAAATRAAGSDPATHFIPVSIQTRGNADSNKSKRVSNIEMKKAQTSSAAVVQQPPERQPPPVHISRLNQGAGSDGFKANQLGAASSEAEAQPARGGRRREPKSSPLAQSGQQVGSQQQRQQQQQQHQEPSRPEQQQVGSQQQHQAQLELPGHVPEQQGHSSLGDLDQAYEPEAAFADGPDCIWSTEDGRVGVQEQSHELTGSDKWRVSDPLVDIESAFDEAAVSELGSTAAEDQQHLNTNTHLGKAAPDTSSIKAPAKSTKASKATQVPVWTCLREPPYKDRSPTKKWFTAGQLKRLEQSDLSSVLSVLSHYPRAYKFFTPQVKPDLDEQCVEVVAKVLEGRVTSIRGRGQAVLSMLVLAPLAPPSEHTLSGGSSSSGDSSMPSLASESSNTASSSSQHGGVTSSSTLSYDRPSAVPAVTVISVTKFAVGGMWAGRGLETLQRELGSQIVLKSSIQAIVPGEEAASLKWIKKKKDASQALPQWTTTGVPELSPFSGGADQQPQQGEQQDQNLQPQGAQQQEQSLAGSLPDASTDVLHESASTTLVSTSPLPLAPSRLGYSLHGYMLEPVYSARTPLKPEDFFSSKPTKTGKDIIGRALEGLEGLAAGDPDSFEPLSGLEGLEGLQLMRWQAALQAVHRPDTMPALNAGRRQLAFQEMFFMQLELLKRRRDFLRLMARIAPPAHITDTRAIDALRKGGPSKGLPYSLTGAQERALVEITEDMRRPVAMLRLLQGDVGSGKTIVAMLAMLAAASSGYQSLLIAPTGILAHQHLHTLQGLVQRLPAKLQEAFGDIVLLTGGLKVGEKRDAVKAIQTGTSRLVISTHSALFTSDWKQLGLVVIDEQHKFGVRQKEGVLKLCKHVQPHILSMSATPIPRTMALVKYGEMVVSALYESPPNRQQVDTSVLKDDASGRAQVQDAIKAELVAGGRAFIVYPLKEQQMGEGVEEEGDLRTATAEFKHLQKHKVFGTDKCVLLHGGMKLEDKAAAVESFRSGQRPVMICTTVVEVGVDVSQASIIVVEHADRFGLAQLHQLRGRVGRGVLKSRCLLLAPTANTVAMERLKVMESCHNGLDIAEADLHLRGAGSVFHAGIKQSGGVDCSDLCSEEVAKDPRIVEVARALAANALMHREGLSPQLQFVAAAHSAMRTGEENEAAGGIAV